MTSEERAEATKRVLMSHKGFCPLCHTDSTVWGRYPNPVIGGDRMENRRCERCGYVGSDYVLLAEDFELEHSA